MKLRTLAGFITLAVMAAGNPVSGQGNKAPKAVKMPNGQYRIEEDGKTVLQYNYQIVNEKDVIRREDEKPKSAPDYEVTGKYRDEYIEQHPGVAKDAKVTSSIYAIPRCDYIHPLYGLQGEMLTRDWPADEPHHRGIWWAWPEVRYGSLQGDLYALQRIFARPTGKVEVANGTHYAQIDAENRWMWEDKKPIVTENAIIRVYAKTGEERIIDITVKLVALDDSISIATRGTNSYGCFNIRMQTPESQSLTYYTDKQDAATVRSWSDLSGTFLGAKEPSGLMILQYKYNPEYPGAWVEYPNLSWVQPAFPTHNTRFALKKGEPLFLRYRLVIHNGGKPDDAVSVKRWDAYNQASVPMTRINEY